MIKKFKLPVLLIGWLSLLSVVSATPLSDFTWTPPTNYNDGTVIPSSDTLTYRLYCSTTSGSGYIFINSYVGGSSAQSVDVSACVNGVPGTYYFVATASSSVYNSESAYSNEITRTYTATDLGKVPNAPILISVT